MQHKNEIEVSDLNRTEQVIHNLNLHQERLETKVRNILRILKVKYPRDLVLLVPQCQEHCLSQALSQSPRTPQHWTKWGKPGCCCPSSPCPHTRPKQQCSVSRRANCYPTAKYSYTLYSLAVGTVQSNVNNLDAQIKKVEDARNMSPPGVAAWQG